MVVRGRADRLSSTIELFIYRKNGEEVVSVKFEDYDELTIEQKMTLEISMHVRNELEDFHVDHIPDTAMPELNATIRYAIYDYFENMANSEQKWSWLVTMIPSYWEIPGRDPKPTFTGEYLWEGKPVPNTTKEGE